jgi:excisionase family DNA binding protein
MKNSDVLDEVVSVDEAAEELDLEKRHVRELLADGVLHGRKISGRWVVDAASVEEFAEELDAEDDDDSDADDGDDDDGDDDEAPRRSAAAADDDGDDGDDDSGDEEEDED